MTDDLKNLIDGGAAVTAIGTLIGLLPSVLTVLAIAWYCIRFYEYFKNKKKPGE